MMETEKATGKVPAPIPASAVDLLSRAHRELLESFNSRTDGDRYVHAHIAALRAAAAVLAVRGKPAIRGGPRPVWVLLAKVAPELADWAAFFADGAAKRAAIEAGRDEVVTTRDADDLLREVETFHVVVESLLGLPSQRVLPAGVPVCLGNVLSA